MCVPRAATKNAHAAAATAVTIAAWQVSRHQLLHRLFLPSRVSSHLCGPWETVLGDFPANSRVAFSSFVPCGAPSYPLLAVTAPPRERLQQLGERSYVPYKRHAKPVPRIANTAGLPDTTADLVERLLAAKACNQPKSTTKKDWRNSKLPMSLDTKTEHCPLVWIDCEMTGLNLGKDRIIEIAVIITDGNLNLIASGPHLIINQPKQLLDGMGHWCKEQHGKSGLTTAVLESKITTEEACQKIMTFVKQHIPRPGSAILAGNSVHVDKEFLKKEMPALIDHLHYRIIDVSTMKQLVQRWAPNVAEGVPSKGGAHRALDDIKESINELAYYRSAIFGSEMPHSALALANQHR